MATAQLTQPTTGADSGEGSPFEEKRAQLLSQVTQNMEQLITNMNQLNRNLESVISVGNQFKSVSVLWRQFSQVVNEEHAAGVPSAEDIEAATEQDR